MVVMCSQVPNKQMQVVSFKCPEITAVQFVQRWWHSPLTYQLQYHKPQYISLIYMTLKGSTYMNVAAAKRLNNPMEPDWLKFILILCVGLKRKSSFLFPQKEFGSFIGDFPTLREAEWSCSVCAGFEARRTLPILQSKSVPNGKTKTVTGNVSARDSTSVISSDATEAHKQTWWGELLPSLLHTSLGSLSCVRACVCVLVMSEEIILNQFIQQGCGLFCL